MTKATQPHNGPSSAYSPNPLIATSLWKRIFARIRDEFFPPVHPFDQAKGVDTSGRLSLRLLGVPSRNRKHGRNYQGIEPGRFFDAMAEIHQDFSGYTFVDLGAGKGRAILMAHELGFGRLVGVEFSAKLAGIAQRNLAKLNIPHAEVVIQDAAEFEFPAGPLVVFTFNSFGPEILRHVVSNMKRHPGPLYLVYLNAFHESVIEHDGSFSPMVRHKFHCIWYRGRDHLTHPCAADPRTSDVELAIGEQN